MDSLARTHTCPHAVFQPVSQWLACVRAQQVVVCGRLPGLLPASPVLSVLVPVFPSTLRLVHILFSGPVPKLLSVPVPPPLPWLLSVSLSMRTFPAAVTVPLSCRLSALGVWVQVPVLRLHGLWEAHFRPLMRLLSSVLLVFFGTS